MKMAQELTGIFFGVLGFSFVFRLQKKLILDICVGSEIVWIIYRLLLYETGYMFISCVAASVFIEIYAEFMSKKTKEHAWHLYNTSCISINSRWRIVLHHECDCTGKYA